MFLAKSGPNANMIGFRPIMAHKLGALPVFCIVVTRVRHLANIFNPSSTAPPKVNPETGESYPLLLGQEMTGTFGSADFSAVSA